MDSIPHKTCSICKLPKPLTEFHRKKNATDGLQSRCKPCHREWWKGYSPDYRKQRRAKDPAWVEHINEIGRKATKRWQDRNPEKTKADALKEAQRRSADPQLRAKYTTLERERRQERQRTDPVFHEHLMDIAKAGQHKRRARLIGSGGNHTLAEWRALCAKYNHRCLCCGLAKPLTRDHVIPLTLGGDNSIANIQCLCRSCNSAKGSRHTTDYRPS